MSDNFNYLWGNPYETLTLPDPVREEKAPAVKVMEAKVTSKPAPTNKVVLVPAKMIIPVPAKSKGKAAVTKEVPAKRVAKSATAAPVAVRAAKVGKSVPVTPKGNKSPKRPTHVPQVVEDGLETMAGFDPKALEKLRKSVVKKSPESKVKVTVTPKVSKGVPMTFKERGTAMPILKASNGPFVGDTDSRTLGFKAGNSVYRMDGRPYFVGKPADLTKNKGAGKFMVIQLGVL